MPRANRDDFVAQSLMTHFDLDVVPHTETDDVLAVSGDRLASSAPGSSTTAAVRSSIWQWFASTMPSNGSSGW